MSMSVSPSGVSAVLGAILSGDADRIDDVSALIRFQPLAYEARDATLLSLTMISLTWESPKARSAEELFVAAYSLDINHPELPIEIPAYAAALDRDNGPDYIDQYSDMVDEANDDRPDRPPLESATIIGPEAFLREVRAAFETGHTSFSQGSPVENDAIALAATLGQLPRTDNLRGT
ncbi:hypothetical protein ACQCX2_09550 [Propionibacteriaceae bacterium Y1700]|uniref:hypothetical protein n=1 Tax=Microlunatus sp. Y1700 TaxID=3418487 RepID=UPI003DA74CCD